MNDKQYYACPIHFDVMKCLFSTGHFTTLSEGLYQIKEYNNCIFALYFNSDQDIKIHCSISVNKISRNSISQLNANHYLMAVIQNGIIECRCPEYTEKINVTPPLTVIVFPKKMFCLYSICHNTNH